MLLADDCTLSYWRLNLSWCSSTLTVGITPLVLWQLHCVSKNRDTWLLIITLANIDQFSNILLADFEENFFCKCVINIFQLTLSVFLPYLVKLENYICGWFQWYIACVISELFVQDLWKSNSKPYQSTPTTGSEKQCSNIQRAIHDVSKLG